MKKSIKIILIIRHVNGEEVDWDSLSEREKPVLIDQNP